MKTTVHFFIISCCLTIGGMFPVSAQPGTLDIGFSGDGILTTDIGNEDDRGNSVAIQSDGKIVVVGSGEDNNQSNFALVRYNSNGTLDTTFSADGKVLTDFGSYSIAYSVAIQSDGKILVAGTMDSLTNDFALARYNTNGSLDSTFSSDGLVSTDFVNLDEFGFSLALQTDGKIVVAGDIGYSDDFAIACYTSEGSLDTTFSLDGKVITDLGNTDDHASSVAIQSDGKIVIAGSSFYENHYEFALIRYNLDGTLDNSFSSDGVVITDMGHSDDYGESVAIQNDGKIIVAGYGGTLDYFDLARYNTDGSLDSTFSEDGILNVEFGNSFAKAHSVAIQNDGKIVVAGESYNFYEHDFALIRCNPDGTLDNSFSFNGKVNTSFGSAKDYCRSIVIQNDGKIVVAGYTDTNPDEFAVARYIGGNMVGVPGITNALTSVNVFPNPSAGIFQVTFASSYQSKSTIIIYNFLGQKVITLVSDSKKEISEGTETVSFNFTNQQKGIYIVEVQNENGIVQKKLVIQ